MLEGGSSNFDDENIPLFVSYVEPKSFMDKTKHIRVNIKSNLPYVENLKQILLKKKGDLIIKINEEPLIGVSNKEACSIIENTFVSDMISISYVRCPDVANDECFFKPTWNYFISIPT
jgi:hypothetical protein